MNDPTPANNDLSHALETVFRSLVRILASDSSPPDTTELVAGVELLRVAFERADLESSLEPSILDAVHQLTDRPCQNEELEAQLRFGRAAMRYMIELVAPDASDASLLVADLDLRKNLLGLKESQRRAEAQRQPPPLRAYHKTAAELDDEQELVREFSVMFREAIRAISANDPRGATLNVVRSFVRMLATLKATSHSFYYYDIFEQAFQAFRNPPRLRDLEIEKLELARAGMRFLATRTQMDDRQRNYQSRLGGDADNFRRIFFELARSSAWNNQPGHRSPFPGA